MTTKCFQNFKLCIMELLLKRNEEIKLEINYEIM